MGYIVCPGCGFLIADKIDVFRAIKTELSQNDKNRDLDSSFELKLGDVLDSLLITKYCCRMNMITYIDFNDLL